MICAIHFASVTTSEVLATQELKLIGVVNRATRKYPMTYLRSKEVQNRFSHLSMVLKDDFGKVLMATTTWVDLDRYILPLSHLPQEKVLLLPETTKSRSIMS